MVQARAQLDWVEEGDAVTLAFADGETVKAQLRGLHPLVDEATRTLRPRMKTRSAIRSPAP